MRIDNADTLPYFVMRAEQRVPVRFTMLEPEDERRIIDTWRGAVYFDLWQYDASQADAYQTTRKLIVADGSNDSILGLLRMGDSSSVLADPVKLNTQAVLETAPRSKYQRRAREFSGAGKVLIARLIAESILRGRNGGLVVTPRPQAIPFYQHLGFRQTRRNSRQFGIQAQYGMNLLESVLLGRVNQ